MNKLCTIMTPTYNRGKLLKNLYKSLLQQKNKKFEWIIIDDGSNDNTKNIVNEFICANIIDIQYFLKKNGGKHKAINFGLQYAKGDLLFIVDSDDVLPSDSIEKIFYYFSTIENSQKYAGIGGLKSYPNNKNVGESFGTHGYIDCTSLERKHFNILGDKAEVFYTDVLKQYPFPEFENEKFLSELVVWYKIAEDGYKIRWFNESIYICEYLEDGLTAHVNDNLIKSPKGFRLYIDALTKESRCNFIRRIYYYGMYSVLLQYKSFTQVKYELSATLLQIIVGKFLYKCILLLKRWAGKEC